MALSKKTGLMSSGNNDLRFLDKLDLVHEFKSQKPAFTLPTTNPAKELPKIAVRPPQWYEEFCCSKQGRKPAARKRQPRPKKRPTPAPLPKVNTVLEIPKEIKPAETDDCLLPLMPVPNPMPCLRVLHFTQEPPSLPPEIRTVRLHLPWGPSAPSSWNRTATLQRPVSAEQPPWAHSRTLLWNKSATLQPGWARSLVHLGKMLQEIGNGKQAEMKALVLAKGEAFSRQLERKCVSLNCLTGECVQLLEQQGKRKRNPGDNS